MTLVTLKWIAGAVGLFIGRELNFLFSALMAALLGFRLSYLLPDGLPLWSDLLLAAVLAAIAAGLTLISKDLGFYVCGFLAGGFLVNELLAANIVNIPFILFFIGAFLLSFILGIARDWGLILVTSVVGIVILYGLLPLFGTAKTLASAGLFVVGAIAQVIMFQMQKDNEE